MAVDNETDLLLHDESKIEAKGSGWIISDLNLYFRTRTQATEAYVGHPPAFEMKAKSQSVSIVYSSTFGTTSAGNDHQGLEQGRRARKAKEASS